jgi:hypothetical protein
MTPTRTNARQSKPIIQVVVLSAKWNRTPSANHSLDELTKTPDGHRVLVETKRTDGDRMASVHMAYAVKIPVESATGYFKAEAAAFPTPSAIGQPGAITEPAWSRTRSGELRRGSTTFHH